MKERLNLSRETNGPDDTISKKTQDSLTLLRKGMNRLIENISSINPSFVDLVDPILLAYKATLSLIITLKNLNVTLLCKINF